MKFSAMNAQTFGRRLATRRSRRSLFSMAKPDPESALYRPVVFDGDYAKIGRAALAGSPAPYPFDQEPDPKLVGEQAYIYERDQLERAARLAESGQNAAEPWNRFDGAVPPGVDAANLERQQQVRAIHGG